MKEGKDKFRKFSTSGNQKFATARGIYIIYGKFSLPESKTKRGFFHTVEIPEAGKRKIQKIPHFPQPKISHPHRYIYI
ncbi:MAG: hypothetical protein F6K22_35800, partial [Okeania sp. SIO2F4]|uniref:hypothetical protein n=1 Tax=Okeania sp. SIO2F4 TaxID=2607790 RepID=UPI00142B7708